MARDISASRRTGWPLGRVAGIELTIDYSWLLIFALVTFSLAQQFALGAADEMGGRPWLAAGAVSLVFFASILLHELGHSLTAQRFGIRVRSITLFLFGGVAELASEARRPREEIVVALAGPLVSVLLGVIFLNLSALLGEQGGLLARGLEWLGRINLLLAAFNVVPGFPLDGGRVLRGVLWALWGDFTRATRVAGACGAAFAWLLMGVGALAAVLGGELVGGLWFVLIGWFLLSAARASVGQEALQRALEKVCVRDTLVPVAGSLLDGSEPVGEVLETRVLRQGRRTFFVVDSAGALRGLVTLKELARVSPAAREGTRVADVMVPADRLAVVSPSESGGSALERMVALSVNQLPVVSEGRLIGAVTREALLDVVRAHLVVRDGAGAGRSATPPR